MSEETPEQIRRLLDLELGRNDSGEATVRGYLVKLLTGVWIEEAEFSGKRPFGNSGWQYDFAPAAIKAGMVDGTLDEDGYVGQLDIATLNRLVLAAIRSFGELQPTADLRALLDHETRLAWQSGCAGQMARAAGVRESAGLEAL